MRYFGSKVSVVEDVFSLTSERIPHGFLCDPFGGVGTVGSYFKNKNYKVYSGDHLAFAHFFQINKIAQNGHPKFETLCNELKIENYQDVISLLNGLKGRDGWLVENFVNQRKFFTLQNGRKIEACWKMIKTWNENGWLSYEENAILIASLINSMDKVSNTAGTYYAYLKNWYRKALRPFNFDLLDYTDGNPDCRCFLCDATSLVEQHKYDILYLDPPYNERSYASYYHLPETIALDENPEVRGKAGIPCAQRPHSSFNRRKEALSALENLLEVANFRLLVFHYSNEGIIPRNSLLKLLMEFGDVEEHILDAKGYVNKSKPRTIQHNLYLVEK